MEFGHCVSYNRILKLPYILPRIHKVNLSLINNELLYSDFAHTFSSPKLKENLLVRATQKNLVEGVM